MSAPKFTTEVPHGMTEVTRDEFFAMLRGDPRDIMPTTESPHQTAWLTKTREMWGWSLPGWRNPQVAPRYAVQSAALAKAAP
jgi:hypothetical protein